jgi:hypothetical protein
MSIAHMYASRSATHGETGSSTDASASSMRRATASAMAVMGSSSSSS